MKRLRAYLGSIRGKFVCYFLLGMLVTLGCVYAINYVTVGEVFTDLNEEISRLEFARAKSDIDAMLDAASKTASELLYSNEMLRLVTYVGRGDYPSAAYPINQLKFAISRHIAANPRIESLYFFIGDEFILQTSGVYTTVNGAGLEGAMPSRRVLEAMRASSRELRALGGLDARDLPLHTKTDKVPSDAPLITLFKAAFFQRTKVTCAINLRESALSAGFEDILRGRSSSLRIVTPDATIVSSVNKSELGTPLRHIGADALARDGETMIGTESLMWRKLYNGALIAVNNVQMSTFLHTIEPIQQRVTLVFIVGMLATCSLFFVWLRRVIAPLGRLIQGMRRAGAGCYDGKLAVRGNDEFSVLTQQYNLMLEELDAFSKRQRRAEKTIRDTELQALRNQINPHFLYNTLNSIRWMAVLSGAEAIEKCVVALGNIIRPLYKCDNPDCTLEEELLLIGHYIQIMNARYDGKIGYADQVPPELRRARIPRLTLQPLVENAVLHGLAPLERKGGIVISVLTEPALMQITVSDDGVGLTDVELSAQNTRLRDEQSSENVGMLNVCKRVRLLYEDDRYGVTLAHNEPRGIRATLALPLLPDG